MDHPPGLFEDLGPLGGPDELRGNRRQPVEQVGGIGGGDGSQRGRHEVAAAFPARKVDGGAGAVVDVLDPHSARTVCGFTEIVELARGQAVHEAPACEGDPEDRRGTGRGDGSGAEIDQGVRQFGRVFDLRDVELRPVEAHRRQLDRFGSTDQM